MSFIGSNTESWADAEDLPRRLRAALAEQCERSAGSGRFAPELSYGRHFGPAPDTARAAAVMILLARRAGDWFIPLTVRPAEMVRHGGQISLPGGTAMEGESSTAAAIRELAEELGEVGGVELLGRLCDCYVYASDFLVTPWVAAIDAEPTWQPDPREVERVVELPVGVLLEPERIDTMSVQRGPVVFRAPCYEFDGNQIWGATAIILNGLTEIIQRAMGHRFTS